MKAWNLSIAAIVIAQCAAAHAADAVLMNAITTYNQLPAKVYTLAFGTTDGAPGQKVTRLPSWLGEAGLTDREAFAAAAAFGVYGNDYLVNYRSRKWGKGAEIAGYVADTVLTNTDRGRGNRLPDAGTNVPPSRELVEWRRTRLLGTLKDMGTCSGALAAAVRKATALRVADDATRLLAKAQRDLGAAALPPDDSCLS
jgi:hypothetical protein